MADTYWDKQYRDGDTLWDADAVNDHLRAVETEARRFGFDRELIDTSLPLGPVLSRYLARRSARLKRA